MDLLHRYTRQAPDGVPTNGQALLVLAELGGHDRADRPLGWPVLGRGLERLLLLELVWVARDFWPDARVSRS